MEKRKESNRNRQRRFRERQLENAMNKENEVKTRKEIQKMKEEKQERNAKKALKMREKRAKMSEDERKAINAERRATYARKKMEAKTASQISVECQTETFTQISKPQSPVPQPKKPILSEPYTPKSQSSEPKPPKPIPSDFHTPKQQTPTSPYKTQAAIRKAASRVMALRSKLPSNPVKMAQVKIYMLT